MGCCLEYDVGCVSEVARWSHVHTCFTFCSCGKCPQFGPNSVFQLKRLHLGLLRLHRVVFLVFTTVYSTLVAEPLIMGGKSKTQTKGRVKEEDPPKQVEPAPAEPETSVKSETPAEPSVKVESTTTPPVAPDVARETPVPRSIISSSSDDGYERPRGRSSKSPDRVEPDDYKDAYEDVPVEAEDREEDRGRDRRKKQDIPEGGKGRKPSKGKRDASKGSQRSNASKGSKGKGGGKGKKSGKGKGKGKGKKGETSKDKDLRKPEDFERSAPPSSTASAPAASGVVLSSRRETSYRPEAFESMDWPQGWPQDEGAGLWQQTRDGQWLKWSNTRGWKRYEEAPSIPSSPVAAPREKSERRKKPPPEPAEPPRKKDEETRQRVKREKRVKDEPNDEEDPPRRRRGREGGRERRGEPQDREKREEHPDRDRSRRERRNEEEPTWPFSQPGRQRRQGDGGGGDDRGERRDRDRGGRDREDRDRDRRKDEDRDRRPPKEERSPPSKRPKPAAPGGGGGDDDDDDDGSDRSHHSSDYTYETLSEEDEVPSSAGALGRARGRGRGQAPSETSRSTVKTSEIRGLLQEQAKKQQSDRLKPSLSQVRIETFKGSRSHYRDWKRTLEAQRALFRLEDHELALLIYT